MRFPKNKAHVFLARRQNADRWITVHPNGADAKGRPALIDGEGIVKGGMGGKFNGKNIKDARKVAEKVSSGDSSEKSSSQKRGDNDDDWAMIDKETPDADSAIKKLNKLMYFDRVGTFRQLTKDNTSEKDAAIKKEIARIKEDFPQAKMYSEIEQRRDFSPAYFEEGLADLKKLGESQDILKKGGSVEEAKKVMLSGVVKDGVAQKRIYMNVPYEKKDEVKKDGARWSSGERSWYVPIGIKMTPSFKKYLPSYFS